jgi:hypothetical protein
MRWACGGIATLLSVKDVLHDAQNLMAEPDASHSLL